MCKLVNVTLTVKSEETAYIYPSYTRQHYKINITLLFIHFTLRMPTRSLWFITQLISLMYMICAHQTLFTVLLKDGFEQHILMKTVFKLLHQTIYIRIIRNI